MEFKDPYIASVEAMNCQEESLIAMKLDKAYETERRLREDLVKSDERETELLAELDSANSRISELEFENLKLKTKLTGYKVACAIKKNIIEPIMVVARA